MDKMRRVPKAVHPNLFEQYETGGPLPVLRDDYSPGAVCQVTEDITGVKGRQYAKNGDKVRILNDHENVMIVEHITSGERIAVLLEKLKPTQ